MLHVRACLELSIKDAVVSIVMVKHFRQCCYKTA